MGIIKYNIYTGISYSCYTSCSTCTLMLPVVLVKLQGLAGLSQWPVSLLLSFQIEVQSEPEVVGLLSCELCPHDGPPDIDTQKIFFHQVTKILLHNNLARLCTQS